MVKSPVPKAKSLVGSIVKRFNVAPLKYTDPVVSVMVEVVFVLRSSPGFALCA